MIVIGLYVFEIPLFGGNTLTHKTTYLDNSITIRPGTLVNGSVLYIALMRFLTVLTCRLMCGTRYRVNAMFIVIIDKCFLRHSNYMSIYTVVTLKCWFSYSFKAFLMDLTRLPSDQSSNYSTVVNMILLDIVTRKGISLTNIMSADNSTSRFICFISSGISM